MHAIRIEELTHAHIGAHLRYTTRSGEVLEGRITDIAPSRIREVAPARLIAVTIDGKRTFFAHDASVEISLLPQTQPRAQRTASKSGITISVCAAAIAFILATLYGLTATHIHQTAVSLTGILCSSALAFRVLCVANRAQKWTR